MLDKLLALQVSVPVDEGGPWRFPWTVITDAIGADTWTIISADTLAGALGGGLAMLAGLVVGRSTAPGWGILAAVLTLGFVGWTTPLGPVVMIWSVIGGLVAIGLVRSPYEAQ